MFEFENKTIEEFRNEVASFVGKEITNKNGDKFILDFVSENSEDSLSALGGNKDIRFNLNGELDWSSMCTLRKMFGFYYTISQTDENGIKMSLNNKVLVPLENKNDKLIIRNEDLASIY
jgi:hypothetical protein